MKHLLRTFIAVAAIAFSMSLAQANILTIVKNYDVGGEDAPDSSEIILKTIHEELKKEGSEFRKQMMDKLTNDPNVWVEDFCFDDCTSYDDVVVGSSLDENDLIYTGSGKGGFAWYGTDYIVPVRAFYPGSGLIEETLGFFKVSVSISLYDVETEQEEYEVTYDFTKFVVL